MVKIVLDGAEQEAFECPEHDTVLRAALRAGFGFPYACNVGSCGTCRFQLLEGEVQHARVDAPAWSERDRKRNRFLGCQSQPQGDCRIKLRLDPAYVPRHRPVRTQALLTDAVEITHDITEFGFTLEIPSGFLPGQYALIGLPEVEGARAYSMCNVAAGNGENREWRFQIKRVPNGKATGYLFDRLRRGEAVQIDGPYGVAYLREDAPRDIVCVAGGSGLSPIISIARAAAASQQLRERRIDVVYGGRTTRDICGRDMLAELPGFGERLHYHAAISDPEADEGEWQGHVGFVHGVTKQLFGEELREREIYFAGPPAMAAAMQQMLFELKVPSGQVHFDEFY